MQELTHDLLLAQNYDGTKSGDGAHLSTATVMKTGMNGGTTAVMTWAIPLVVALVLALVLGALWRRHDHGRTGFSS